MSKKELLDALVSKGHDKSFGRQQEWFNAFNAFNADPGQRLKMKIGCGSCYRKVLDWLRS